MCEPEGPMNVTCAPWSKAATSKAQRVLVESFSKISAISLPTSTCFSRPSRFAALSSAARSTRYLISSGVKSASFIRCRPRMLVVVLMLSLLVSRLANDGAGHAVPAPPSAAELLARDGEHLDACLQELGVGGLVALVADDDPRLERDDVVAVVPLVPLGLELVATGGDELEVGDPEGVAYLVEERALGDHGLHAGRAARPEHDRQDPRDHRLVQRHDVPVAEREHRVEVHRGPL